MTQEVWRPITKYQGHKFDGRFEVSNWGNVRNRQIKMQQPFYTDNRGQGYYKFKLFDIEKNRVAIKVHRLVALEFIGDGKGREVDHIDGNAKNNSFTNLRWVSHADNMRFWRENENYVKSVVDVKEYGQILLPFMRCE